jgi:hypothetical protein
MKTKLTTKKLISLKNMAESRCLALILALNRQVKETGRMDFPVTSIIVIIKELKNAKKEK